MNGFNQDKNDCIRLIKFAYLEFFFVLYGLDGSPGVTARLNVVLVSHTEQVALIIRQVLLEL